MNIIERLGEISRGAAQRLQVKSAMNPILWLAAIISPAAFGFATLLRSDPMAKTLLLVLGSVPPIVACCVFVYFAVKRPDKLQSEDYQIRQHTLELIASKAVTLNVGEVSLDAIADLRPRLPATGGDGE